MLFPFSYYNHMENHMSNTDQEIKTLFPNKEITLSTGEVITLKPFTFGQLPQAIKLVEKLGGVLQRLIKEGALADRTKTATAVMVVISEGGEDLINLISLGINKPREWFDSLQSDDGMHLTIGFLEVNLDFFTKKMMPRLLEVMEQANKGKNQ